MVDIGASLLYLLAYAAGGLPPRRLANVLWDWGGAYVAYPYAAGYLPRQLDAEALEVLRHAYDYGNYIAAAWIWPERLTKSVELWLFITSHLTKIRYRWLRRVMAFCGWNKTCLHETGHAAVRWIYSNCIAAVVWSFPDPRIYDWRRLTRYGRT
jgi:hypothetical protein